MLASLAGCLPGTPPVLTLSCTYCSACRPACDCSCASHIYCHTHWLACCSHLQGVRAALACLTPSVGHAVLFPAATVAHVPHPSHHTPQFPTCCSPHLQGVCQVSHMSSLFLTNTVGHAVLSGAYHCTWHTSTAFINDSLVTITTLKVEICRKQPSPAGCLPGKQGWPS